MRKKIRVAVIFGGRSGEHEVSLVSARSVMAALNPKKYAVTPVKIKKNGKWENSKYASLPFLKKNFDVVFPVLHGPFGEDGTIQGMLEMADVPYVGCDTASSALCMDKYMAKMACEAYGLPQTKFIHATREEIGRQFPTLKKNVVRQLGFPCFVKPSNLGSSVGISKVKKPEELKKALKLAAEYDFSILIEKGIDAREIEVAVLGNEEPIASVAGEIIPNREFYDYYSKYVDNASTLLIPAPLSPKKMAEAQRIAQKAFTALQCSGMARVDFLMDKKTDKFYLSEANSIPGFTSISMYPKLFAASGIPYPKLLDRLISLAIERHRKKSKRKFSFESGSDWHEK